MSRLWGVSRSGSQARAASEGWLPNEVRLARKDGDAGDYKFSFIHFAGVRGEDTHVGVTGHQEVAGGLLGFSTTSAPPAHVSRSPRTRY